MLLSTVSPGASPVQDLQADATQTPAGTVATGADSFASRLAQALDGLPPGQNIAADGLPLTSVTLGPSLELITTGAAQPDGESLAAFAAAQGLDPEVVAWLFSDGGASAETGATATEGDGQETPSEGALDAALQAGMLLPQGLLIPLPPPSQTAAATVPSAEGAEGATAGAGLSAALLGAALMPASGWLGQAGLGGDAKAAQLAQAQALTTVPDAAGSFAAAQAMASAGLPAQVLGKPDINAKVDIGSKAFGMPVEVLSLDLDPFALSLLEEADGPAGKAAASSADAATANGQPVMAAGPGAGGAAAQAASSDPASETARTNAAEQRAEALHTLAQRLGEAVGQRVLGQIARGNWSMKLMLKPATLGDVEVDLRMRSGELNASFITMNPMTRDLLNDGLSRLREVLTGAGMDIAGLHVGQGSSQSAGGNPTPRQSMANEGQSIAPVGAKNGAELVAPAGAVAVRRAGSANWDVLV
jgi:hypothetical protein